jgi:hypothetical protein
MWGTRRGQQAQQCCWQCTVTPNRQHKCSLMVQGCQCWAACAHGFCCSSASFQYYVASSTVTAPASCAGGDTRTCAHNMCHCCSWQLGSSNTASVMCFQPPCGPYTCRLLCKHMGKASFGAHQFSHVPAPLHFPLLIVACLSLHYLIHVPITRPLVWPWPFYYHCKMLEAYTNACNFLLQERHVLCCLLVPVLLVMLEVVRFLACARLDCVVESTAQVLGVHLQVTQQQLQQWRVSYFVSP